MTKHTSILNSLDFEDGTEGGDGESGSRDMFRKLCYVLGKDIETLLTDVAKKVLTLDVKKNMKDNSDLSAELWESEAANILNQVDTILEAKDDPNTDKFLIVSKLLNMREDLQR